jgi:hypothetical protein
MAIVPSSKNGTYSSVLLGQLPGVNGNGTAHMADKLAVDSYNRLRRDMLAAGQGDLIPSSGYSCYRSIAQQRLMLAQNLTKVQPGKSIHGEAGGKAAVDFKDITSGTAGLRRHAWLVKNAGRYGWYQPRWAVTGISGVQAPEPWHWEYDAAMDRRPQPPVKPKPPQPKPPIIPKPLPPVPVNLKGNTMFVTIKGRSAWRLIVGDRILAISQADYNTFVAAGIPHGALSLTLIDAMEAALTSEK